MFEGKKGTMNKQSKTFTNRQTVTAQDVADKAGVSRASVSRTFTSNGSIAPETREKVMRAASELGYQVNFLAQGLNRKRSQLIGVVVARLSDPFRSSLLESLLTEIHEKGYQALVTEVKNQEQLEETIRQFTQYRVSGVVVTSGQPPTELVSECVQHNIPVVGINRHMDLPYVDFVCSDNKMGAELALAQLLQSKCRALGWLNYKGSTWAGVNRGKTYRRLVESKQPEFGLTLSDLTAFEDGYEGGRAAAHDYCLSLKTGSVSKLDGIFCANAQLACGFLDGMRECGFEAPKEFHLIGFDDTQITAQYSYRLTTIRQNTSAMASQAIACLEARGADANSAQRIEMIPVSLVCRHTSPMND
ncbi:LacI family transcriptional regulator [Marinomonas balearica]|uniref:LacI family transcriptional regulator n=2 Tax=Marinomonas balearica TaxID=491947 RepID=A0A4V3CGT4_9GAMM|nr:LacI family transcriptional regulator [Marinomonas balearica]